MARFQRRMAMLVLGLGWLVCGTCVAAQNDPAKPTPKRIGLGEVVERLESEGVARLDRLGIELRDESFEHAGKGVEAISCRPLAGGQEARHPAMLLIPGYSKTSRDYVPLMVRLGKQGYASLAVTQPGFGKSAGPSDFVGPRTMEVVEGGLDRLMDLEFVDRDRVGVFGYSRGAMAASMLACRRDDLACAVFGAGIYDLEMAYDAIAIEGIRENIEKETGGASAAALRARSSIHELDALSCPVLILHGGKDINAPVEQAEMLRDRLEEHGKEVKIVIYPDRDHDIGRQNLNEAMGAFLRDRMGE